MPSKFDGQIMFYAPHGYVHAFERIGWIAEPHILQGTHHGEHAEAVRWGGEGEPVFPAGWKEVA